MMNFWAFADKNPGWTFLFLLVVAYGAEQAAKALRGSGKKRKRN
ncbi:hypothetical protein PCS82_26615 (plasmid) [Escherichia coli]|nr:hypothetical protein [Escherichia coli]MCT9709178.1 hypothetical protein [Escherichia coli]WMO97466.1 hypothetical protein PCS82_26615 [Escherichia coli]